MKKNKISKKERIIKPEQYYQEKSYVGISDSDSVYLQKSPVFTVSEIKDLIKDDFWINACVSTIADEVVKYPLTVQLEKGIKSNTYLRGQIAKINAFLKYPSDVEPFFLIRRKYIKDMLRYGNGCCLIDYNKNVPSKLRVAPGYTLGVTDKEPVTYVFRKAKLSDSLLTDDKGKTIELTNKQVMHFQLDADSDSPLASSPLNPLYYHLGSDIELVKRVMLTSKKGGLLPSMLGVERANEKIFKSFLKWMNKELENGAAIAGLNKKVAINELPHWTGAETINMFRWFGNCIATAFKVPPFMLNLVENVGSLNAREQYSRFLENVVEPILKYESYLFSMILVKKGFLSTKLEITHPMIATKLNYSRARIARTLSTQDQEIFTVDEIRKDIFGMESKTNTTEKPKKK